MAHVMESRPKAAPMVQHRPSEFEYMDWKALEERSLNDLQGLYTSKGLAQTGNTLALIQKFLVEGCTFADRGDLPEDADSTSQVDKLQAMHRPPTKK